MQNYQASGQFHKGIVNYSLLVRLKSKDHALGNIKCFGYVCFASEPISSLSLASESTFRNPFFRNPCRIPVFQNPFFQNLFFLEHPFFGIHCFRNPFFSEFIYWNPFFGTHLFGIHFFGIHVHFFGIHFRHLGKNEKNENFGKWSCVLLWKAVKISDFIFSEPLHFGVFDFFLSCGEVQASIQFWGGVVCGGRGLAVKLSLVGFWRFRQRICLRVCLEVLQNYDPGQRNPVSS